MKYLKRFESIQEEDKYIIKIGWEGRMLCVNSQANLESWLNDFDNIDEYWKNEAQKYWILFIERISKIETIRRTDSNLDNWEICKLEGQPRRVNKSDDDTSREIILRLLREEIIDAETNFKDFKQLKIEKKVEFINYLNDNEWLVKNGQISKVFDKSEIEFELDNLIDFYITQILYPV